VHPIKCWDLGANCDVHITKCWEYGLVSGCYTDGFMCLVGVQCLRQHAARDA
jgi:hypothetical protein